MSFRAFWPHYLAEHRRPWTRRVHLAGTFAWMGLLAWMAATGRWGWAALLPAAGYGPAWFSHFVIERNRPATFRHPWLSLVGDHVMAWYMVTGGMDAELARLGLD